MKGTSMNYIKAIAGLIAILAVTPSYALAEGYVVAHSSVRLGASDIKEVFVGNMQFAGSIKLVPVDNGAVQGDFLSKMLKMDPDRYANTWAKKSFREGLTPPPIKSGDAEVLDFVKRTPGAIGYVSRQAAGANVIVQY